MSLAQIELDEDKCCFELGVSPLKDVFGRTRLKVWLNEGRRPAKVRCSGLGSMGGWVGGWWWGVEGGGRGVENGKVVCNQTHGGHTNVCHLTAQNASVLATCTVSSLSPCHIFMFYLVTYMLSCLSHGHILTRYFASVRAIYSPTLSCLNPGHILTLSCGCVVSAGTSVPWVCI